MRANAPQDEQWEGNNMSRRNLQRDPNTQQLLDTFDTKSLAGATSSVGFLGVRTLTDIAIDFFWRLVPFGRVFG